MKTYFKIFTLLALLIVVGFSSCTNDDITYDYTTNFKINPSGVISPFTFEINTGELQSFDPAYELRIQLLVYDSNGNIVGEQFDQLSNYQSTSSLSMKLPKGNYTGIAITDVVKKDGSLSFWTLKDSASLSTTKIVDNGKTGGNYKILGIKKTNFTVNGTKMGDISIAVEPAGALICTLYRNIHTYSDVAYLGVKSSKSADYCLFDNQGILSYNEVNRGGTYDWWLNYLTIANNSSSDNIYDYIFIFPSTNLNLKYVAVTGSDAYVDETSSSFYALSDAMTISPKAGEEYFFSMNLGDAANNYDISYQLANGSSTKSKALSSLQNIALGKMTMNSNALYLKDVK